MKYFILAFMVAFGISTADTWVNGYFKEDGTYVPGHWRSDPDGDPSNNWTTKGNSNPYTGKPGTKSVPSYNCSYKWIDGYTDSNGIWHPGKMRYVCAD